MVIYRTSLNCIFASGQLKEGEMYDVDFDHQFIETEKYDAKPYIQEVPWLSPWCGGYWRFDSRYNP